MARPYKSWSPDEIARLRSWRRDGVILKECAARLGREIRSVARKCSREKILLSGEGVLSAFYTLPPADIDFVRQRAAKEGTLPSRWLHRLIAKTRKDIEHANV